MTGAGFGGCAIVLVADSAVESLRERFRAGYDTRFGKPADVFTSAAASGAECTEL